MDPPSGQRHLEALHRLNVMQNIAFHARVVGFIESHARARLRGQSLPGTLGSCKCERERAVGLQARPARIPLGQPGVRHIQLH